MFIHVNSKNKKETGSLDRSEEDRQHGRQHHGQNNLLKKEKHDRFDVRLQQMVGWRDKGMKTRLSFKEECKVSFRGGGGISG